MVDETLKLLVQRQRIQAAPEQLAGPGNFESMLTNLFPRSERGHAMSQVVRQTRILLDCALVKSVGFTRVQSQVANPFSVSHQRKRHARSITASDGFVAPRCKGRVGTIVFDPIRFAGPGGDPPRHSWPFPGSRGQTRPWLPHAPSFQHRLRIDQPRLTEDLPPPPEFGKPTEIIPIRR